METWLKELRTFAISEVEGGGVTIVCCHLDCKWTLLIGDRYLAEVVESAQVHNIRATH